MFTSFNSLIEKKKQEIPFIDGSLIMFQSSNNKFKVEFICSTKEKQAFVNELFIGIVHVWEEEWNMHCAACVCVCVCVY